MTITATVTAATEAIIDESDYQSVRTHAETWIEPLRKELDRKKQRSIDLQSDPSGSEADCVAGFQVGGALLLICVHTNTVEKTFTPVLVVTELSPRKHRVGIGHHHTYFMTANKQPNFKKAVSNAMERADEIRELGDQKTQMTMVSVNCDELSRQELTGVPVPGGMLLNRHIDGTYSMHVGTIKASLTQVKGICRILADPDLA